MICIVTACTMQHTENKTKQQQKKKKTIQMKLYKAAQGHK